MQLPTSDKRWNMLGGFASGGGIVCGLVKGVIIIKFTFLGNQYNYVEICGTILDVALNIKS